MNKLLSAGCSDEGRRFKSIYGNSRGGSFVLGCFLSSLVVPPYRYLIRSKGRQGAQSGSPFNASAWSLASSNKMSEPLPRFTGNFQYRWLWSINSTVPDKSDPLFYRSLSSPSPALSFSSTLSLFLPSNCMFLCPNFPFSSLSHCTFVLSLPLYFKSVSSRAAPLFYPCLFMRLLLCVTWEGTLWKGIFPVLVPTHPKTALHLPTLDSFIWNCAQYAQQECVRLRWRWSRWQREWLTLFCKLHRKRNLSFILNAIFICGSYSSEIVAETGVWCRCLGS